MSGKKTTPARRARARAGVPDLADLISGVLKHPDTPVELHTHIGDWVISYGNAKIDEPERIRRALDEYNAIEARAAKQRKGAK
jgi:hypothetical protein